MTAVLPSFAFDCVIGGELVGSPERLPVVFPYTGDVIGSAPSLGREEVRRALDRSHAVDASLPRYERARILTDVARRLAAERDELARLITWESGLCLKDTLHEVARAVDVFRLAAAEALRDDGRVFACDISANGRDRRAYTLAEPVALVAAIAPFNHPLNQVAHKVAPAVAVGAPMVLKPSEKTPLSGLWLARALLEAGLPDDHVNVVTGDPVAIVEEMLAHPGVELVSFTGSAEVGKAIAARLGYRRAVLELGGNDPLLVLPDADLDEAVRLAVAGAYKNSGQRCTAVKRLIVHDDVADPFVERLAAATQELVVDDPFDPRTDVGTVISQEAAALLERRIFDAVADGARLVSGGFRRGAQLAPTVLDRVSPDSELVVEESFGPIAPVLRIHDLDEAIALANATRFGLSAGVVTNDLGAINRCIRELRCGTVNVREVPGFRTELTPFGGIKDSGLGVKEGVVEAMRAMTFTKLYTLPWD
jgi:aldehyde dehydrogenase (NAD+)